MSIELIRTFTRETPSEPSFADRHTSKIAFTISTLVQFILSPLSLILGASAGFAYSYYTEPNLTLGPDDKVITVPTAVFAVVGAFAAFIQIMPVGPMGGGIFKIVPFASSFTIGTTVHRALKNISLL